MVRGWRGNRGPEMQVWRIKGECLRLHTGRTEMGGCLSGDVVGVTCPGLSMLEKMFCERQPTPSVWKGRTQARCYGSLADDLYVERVRESTDLGRASYISYVVKHKKEQ